MSKFCRQICLLVCVTLPVLFLNTTHAQTLDVSPLGESFESFMTQFKGDNKDLETLDQLDITSQKLITTLQDCEAKSEDEIEQLTQIKEIDALKPSSNSENENNENSPNEVESDVIADKINRAKNILIDCRLQLNQVEEARIEILEMKRNLWIEEMKVQHNIWAFATDNNQNQDLKLSQIFSLQWLSVGFILSSLVIYFSLAAKFSGFNISPTPSTQKFSELKNAAVTLLKIHLIPLLLGAAHFIVIDAPHQWVLLIINVSLLVRDVCVLLPFRMLLSNKYVTNLRKFATYSTLLIVTTGFAWNGLDYRQNNVDSWLASQSAALTPLFFGVCVLLFLTLWQLYKLLAEYKDRYIALIMMGTTVLSLLAYISTFAKAAQYMLVLTLGSLLMLLLMKGINAVRKILLLNRVKKLKSQQEDDQSEVIYTFPFWVTLLTSLVGATAVFAFLTWLGGTSKEVYQQISFIYNEGFDLGSARIVPNDIFVAIVLVVIFIIILSRVRHGIEYQWFNKSRLRKGPREVVSMLVWYAGITIATFIGLSIAGFDVSNLAIIAGALSVGIGFGLQNIVSNFVSGLILLFERPVKTGDWVEVGETVGFIEKVKIRATRIKTFDNAEILVPNSELLSHHVTNWTLSNSIGRIIVKVGVAYGSDTEQVKKILTQVAEENDQVINYAPYKFKVLFREFGDSSLNFELRVMIRDIKQFLDVQSQLNYKIDQAFRAADITIPFPQRDLHVIDTVRVKTQNTSTQDSEPSDNDEDQVKKNADSNEEQESTDGSEKNSNKDDQNQTNKQGSSSKETNADLPD